MDAGHGSPGEGIGIEQLPKELGDISQFVGLQSVDSGILGDNNDDVMLTEVHREATGVMM